MDMGEADGQEVLVVDGDDKVQRGLAQLLSSSNLVPTVMSDPDRARALAKEKFFPVAVIDLDTPEPNAGLELVRWFKQDSPITTTFVICSRKAFESAVEAFRAGAADIVLKSPDQVERLLRRVLDAATSSKTRAAEEHLLAEALAVHEDFLKRLMETSRRVSELEEQLGGMSQVSELDIDCQIVVVEPTNGDWLASGLNELLRGKTGFVLHTAGSGSEGMDLAGRMRSQRALISDQLPDLPGSMVVSAFKQQSPDTITILYSRPGVKPGKAEIVEGSRVIPLVNEFSDARQIVQRIDELREAGHRTSRERRYLAQFRQDNYQLIKKYADLKQKLTRAKAAHAPLVLCARRTGSVHAGGGARSSSMCWIPGHADMNLQRAFLFAGRDEAEVFHVFDHGPEPDRPCGESRASCVAADDLHDAADHGREHRRHLLAQRYRARTPSSPATARAARAVRRVGALSIQSSTPAVAS